VNRNLQLQAQGAALLLCLALAPAPAVSEEGPDDLLDGSVDFRMTSLEQTKKIVGQIRSLQDTGRPFVTMTIMNTLATARGEDRQHLIVPPDAATPEYIRNQLGGGQVDSVSWSVPVGIAPLGSCDSQTDCEAKTEVMCKNAGHDGVDKATVEVTTHLDGSKTCSGTCKEGGAVAFVTCSPS
jgi:hypothetical protein